MLKAKKANAKNKKRLMLKTKKANAKNEKG